MTLEIFKCNLCAKSCDTRGKLNRHMKAHSKPFRCDTCSGGFALRLDLERHIKARHRVGEDQHRCPVDRCWKIFKRKDNLKRHVRKHHPNALLSAKSNDFTADTTITASLPQDVGMSLAIGSFNGIYSVSMFMRAATFGNIATLELLMNSKFTMETRADDGSTALHCAARNGQAKTVQYLLEKGADLGAENKSGRTPLHEGFLSNDIDTVKVLIERVPEEYLQSTNWMDLDCLAQVKNIKVFELYEQQRKVGLDPERVNVVFTKAIAAKNDALVAVLLDRPDVNVNGYDWGYPPILDAARYGNTKTMELFLNSDRFDNSVTTKGRMNALHIAASSGHPNIVEQLLHLNFDVESLDARLRTPLQLAAIRGHFEVIKLLVEKWKADISSSDQHGCTPIHHAAFRGHWECVHVLFGYIASRNHRDILDIPFENKDFVKKDAVIRLLNTAAFEDPNMRYWYRTEKTLLHLVVQKGDIEVIEVLLAHDKIDINATNKWGYSPLRLAVEHRQIEAARLLLQHPEIEVDLKVWCVGTALNHARDSGYQEMVDLLLSYGAKDDEAGNAPTITMQDSSSVTTVKAGQISNTLLQLQHEIDPEFDSDTLMDVIPALDDHSDAEYELEFS